jgi:hypothetical protein
MGSGKLENLILTVRDDHFLDSPNHVLGGPKVHFDLAGYDILRWKHDELDVFRSELEKRIRRRMANIDQNEKEPTGKIEGTNRYWHLVQRSKAEEGIARIDRVAFMEVTFSLPQSIDRFTLPQLRKAAQDAQITTFGWPIAPFLDREEFKPRPITDGISAEIVPDAKESYDYWAIRTNGDFYWMGSLFEDERTPGEIFFDTRIVRVTEALQYCRKLYHLLGLDDQRIVQIHVRHRGLKGRKLSSADSRRHISRRTPAIEDQSEVDFPLPLGEIDAQLVTNVKKVLAPLFSLFDFFELSDTVYREIVDKFAKDEL